MNTEHNDFQQWIARRKNFVLRHKGSCHPFFDALPTYCRNKGFLQIAFRQIFHVVLGFPFHIAGAIASSRDEMLLKTLIHNLYAEVGGADGDAHISIYRKLLRAVGVSTDRPTSDELWNEALHLELECSYLYRHENSGFKLGSLFAFECMSSPMVARWTEALRHNSDLKEDDFEFFSIHIEIEAEHIDDISECCRAYYSDSTFTADFDSGSTRIMKALEAFWGKMDSEARRLQANLQA